jgi:hypothetical protein
MPHTCSFLLGTASTVAFTRSTEQVRINKMAPLGTRWDWNRAMILEILVGGNVMITIFDDFEQF